MDIKKIVLTGGPCAGKSTALELIRKRFTNEGYYVVFLPEMATVLHNIGVKCKDFNKMVDYEEVLLKFQFETEHLLNESVKRIGVDKVLIVCDRGVLDCKTFITDKEFDDIIKKLNVNFNPNTYYDAIFHLTTSAIGAEEHYNLDNPARREGVKDAVLQDEKLVEVYNKHKYHRIIDNSTNFNDKMTKLLNSIEEFLNS